MKKTINRTFIVKTGKQLIPDFENRSFDEKEITLFDNDPIPENASIDRVITVKASMPLDEFFDKAVKTVVSEADFIPDGKEFPD